MRGYRAISVLPIVLLASVAPALGTQDLWLLPDPPAPHPGQDVVVRLMQGEPFEGRQASFGGREAGRFQRVWKRGRKNLAPPGFVPSEPGVQLVVYDDPPHRFCKALVIVGEASSGDPIRYSEVGHRLEIVPQTDPVALQRRGGELEVQILFEHEPLAGAIVVALPRKAPREGRRTAVTDEIGLARFDLDRSGTWMVRVVHAAAGARATLVFEGGADR